MDDRGHQEQQVKGCIYEYSQVVVGKTYRMWCVLPRLSSFSRLPIPVPDPQPASHQVKLPLPCVPTFYRAANEPFGRVLGRAGISHAAQPSSRKGDETKSNLTRLE